MSKVAIYKPQTTSLISIINRQNKIELALFEKSLTIRDAIQGTHIYKLQRHDEQKTLIYIVFLLARMNDNFSLPIEKKLNSSQLYDLAIDLLELFSHETIEDLTLMLKMVRQGKLGGKIHRIDPNLIMSEWVPEYLELKSKEYERLIIAEKDKHSATATGKLPLALQKVYEKQKIVEWIKQNTPLMDRQMLEDTILTWQKDEKLKVYVDLLKQRRKTLTQKL